MEQEFKNWLVSIGLAIAGAANSYSRAIPMLSEHYSQNTDSNVDIYSITDQNIISQIAHDYSQSGRFSEFGYEQHSRFRAAIKRYSEFFVQRHYTANEETDAQDIVEPETEPLQANFAYERDLQTTLCSQISELFPGYCIFGEANEGIEYLIDRKRIDVLLQHIESGALLAVELKSGIADFRVFGQISMYLGLLQRKFPDKSISGVIVAGVIDESLKYACLTTDKVNLKVYRMSLELENA
ncbi:MAG: hypothetical protein COA96_01340 [SAR86 cluster bacterium]|uniref:DUF91 domain-containing protein n=1 Tax=SAR86 cluster bacterium TaxID=2030880 RepID=A0A2A5BA22_9GAMM|nr:MAG: hypothetical protein COA96_01340 [SAR86 cluster bacterium]